MRSSVGEKEEHLALSFQAPSNKVVSVTRAMFTPDFVRKQVLYVDTASNAREWPSRILENYWAMMVRLLVTRLVSRRLSFIQEPFGMYSESLEGT